MREDDIRTIPDGSHFYFKRFEWIVLDNNVEGGVLAIMASSWNGDEYCFDEDCCNNYAESSLRRKLLSELLPVLGEDNFIPHEVDLVADNGDDRYGTVKDKVFILSCDEYRKYRKNHYCLSGCGLAHLGISQTPGAVATFAMCTWVVVWTTTLRTACMELPLLVYSIQKK